MLWQRWSSRWETEKAHFLALKPLAQSLLVSIFFFEVAYPLLSLFVNAFILRQTASGVAVAWYNVGLFITLPLAFLLNGILMKYKPIQFWHWVGMVGQAASVLLLIWLEVKTVPQIFAFGLLQGIPMGLYYSNRNFLSLDSTEDAHRTYFVGLEMIFATVASVVVPVVVGWFLLASEWSHLYTINQAYLIMGLVALAITAYGGWRLAALKIQQPRPSKLLVGRASTTWWWARVVEILYGVQNGLDLFTTPIIVFAFLGKEGVLGTAQSLAALVAAAILYIVARKVKPSQRVTMLFRSIMGLTLLTLSFVGFFRAEFAFIYVLFIGMFVHLNWMLRNPIANKAIEDEDGGDATNNYSYVVDREIVLNIGRIAGVMVFFVVSNAMGELMALRVVLIVAICCQWGMLMAVKQLVQRLA